MNESKPDPSLPSLKDLAEVLKVVKDPIVQAGLGGIGLVVFGVVWVVTRVHLSDLQLGMVLLCFLAIGIAALLVIRDGYLKALRIRARQEATKRRAQP